MIGAAVSGVPLFYFGGACAIYSVADIIEDGEGNETTGASARVVACLLWPMEALARLMDPDA